MAIFAAVSAAISAVISAVISAAISAAAEKPAVVVLTVKWLYPVKISPLLRGLQPRITCPQAKMAILTSTSAHRPAWIYLSPA